MIEFKAEKLFEQHDTIPSVSNQQVKARKSVQPEKCSSDTQGIAHIIIKILIHVFFYFYTAQILSRRITLGLVPLDEKTHFSAG